ncbi:putative U-box domain-containing protein 50 isoform X1 [Rhododendron vialii]|uniref:putative U-box domain-containing protein 50 isoform X1 n=2 Tax=Rhododendron vialii TaxID=182163 RepID=UPI00265E17EA|nr:putative U-box domain-containing protein 50 isoform X1 [Rhododendron vialii]
MGNEAEKVYVALGNDLQDGFATLEWVLRKWSSHSISIVILHDAPIDTSKDYVCTPLGKLPASYLTEEKQEAHRKIKEGEDDKLLSQYQAFCGQVKVELLKIQKHDEPLHNLLVELMLEITKLVIGISFMRSTLWKSHRLSGLLHVHRQRPDWCDIFLISGGKLVFLREENNEVIIEDDQRHMVAKFKEKGSFRALLGIKFPAPANNAKNSPSPSMSNSQDQYGNSEEEIESYFHQLLLSISDEEGSEIETDALQNSEAEQEIQENMSAADEVEMLKVKIRKAQDMIELKRKEAKDNFERHAKAEWAISVCTHRAEELEAHINEEITTRADLKKELDSAKDEVEEIQTEVEDKKNKLKTILELQNDLSNKLRLSSMAKSQVDAKLEEAVTARADMVQKIEELRRQKDVLQRRVEFCREKDAIGMATRNSDLGFSSRKFTSEEIRAVTNDFSERLRLKSVGRWTTVYRGRINNTAVAIKVDSSANGISQDAFEAKVKALSHIRHPHLVAMYGFCLELKCIVFEYMHNGCLRDALFSVCGRGNRSRIQGGLNWHARIRIAAEVSSGLGFLHSAQPRPISLGNLNPSKILLDRNLASKIHGFRPGWCHDQSDVWSDIRAFGNIVLQLLSGRNWFRLLDEAVVIDRTGLVEVLDETAGEWPVDLAAELAGIARRCLDDGGRLERDSLMVTVFKEIEQVRKKADDLVAARECEVSTREGVYTEEDSRNVPEVFLCPIFQVVMKNPHIAADGFSYELEAIEECLKIHDTSPVTNLKLKHKLLTPNQTLRSLIRDWRSKRSIPLT